MPMSLLDHERMLLYPVSCFCFCLATVFSWCCRYRIRSFRIYIHRKFIILITYLYSEVLREIFVGRL